MEKLSPFYPAMVVFVGALVVAGGAFWASFRQSNFNIELRNKNNEIAALQKENADTITGGDSFAEVAFRVLDQSGNMPNAFAMPDQLVLNPIVIHHGKYPLYDVKARVHKFGSINLDTAIDVGNLTPGFASNNAVVRIPQQGKNLSYNIFFVARNGGWNQFLRMLWVGDGWARASKIVRGDKVLLREVSANFPRNEKDEIDWGEPGAQDQPGDKK
jgi:hypothetical protein